MLFIRRRFFSVEQVKNAGFDFFFLFSKEGNVFVQLFITKY